MSRSLNPNLKLWVRSPAEAEIYATKEVVREAQGINWVMRDLGMTGLNLGKSNQDGLGSQGWGQTESDRFQPQQDYPQF